jgi:hypothetical protein
MSVTRTLSGSGPSRRFAASESSAVPSGVFRGRSGRYRRPPESTPGSRWGRGSSGPSFRHGRSGHSSSSAPETRPGQWPSRHRLPWSWGRSADRCRGWRSGQPSSRPAGSRFSRGGHECPKPGKTLLFEGRKKLSDGLFLAVGILKPAKFARPPVQIKPAYQVIQFGCQG